MEKEKWLTKGQGQKEREREKNFDILSRNAIKNIFSKEVNPLNRRQLWNIKRNTCREISLNPLIYGLLEF